ncbi:GNAT family N-acetyltransferase [Solicola gregarius]|uniref:GNAT family N-acetyltransferase n=1 Tax=Solicola gregarius TaxID=2908642 RepID=A0AA46TJP0_9ACTN|nr:GNAT family N-acetyltransferase [Solicola gregarius]UYM06335.1 GNAT family N-acetyltransferase [Solicola gregarius]
MTKDSAAEGPDGEACDCAGSTGGLEYRLATDRSLLQPLRDLLLQIEAEGDIGISAEKEVAYFGRGTGAYFAVADSTDQVVGYLSGTRRNGNAGDHAVDDGAVVAFIHMLAVGQARRGRGVGFRAVQLFAEHAREVESASLLALQLDDGGDFDLRRARFERMGFCFEELVGLVNIDELLGLGFS